MPSGAVASPPWASGSWEDTAWEAESWGEGAAPEPGGPEPERMAVDAVDAPRTSIDAELRI
jgi:hypothetical protein